MLHNINQTILQEEQTNIVNYFTNILKSFRSLFCRRIGATPLMWAAYEGNIKIIKILLESGADINASDNSKHSVLCYACGPHGSLEAIKYLGDNGANVNPDTNGNDTPLMHASMWVSDDAVKYLLQKGAKVDANNKEGDTALLLVGNAGNESTLRVVKTLNGKDADANRIQHSELPATNKGHERK